MANNIKSIPSKLNELSLKLDILIEQSNIRSQANISHQQVGSLQQENQLLKNHIEVLENRINELTSLLTHINKENQLLKQQITLLVKSISWKITKPLRGSILLCKKVYNFLSFPKKILLFFKEILFTLLFLAYLVARKIYVKRKTFHQFNSSNKSGSIFNRILYKIAKKIVALLKRRINTFQQPTPLFLNLIALIKKYAPYLYVMLKQKFSDSLSLNAADSSVTHLKALIEINKFNYLPPRALHVYEKLKLAIEHKQKEKS